MTDDGKRPRHYAAEIIAEKKIERRREMLTAVPDQWRDMTETHVLNWYEMNGERKRNSKRSTER